jgi:hypothetical protein
VGASVLEWLLSDLPKAGTIAAALVSVAAAIGSVVLAHSNSRLLERQKNAYQRELETLKNRLQGNLEDRKSELQTGLEERKSQLQANLEDRKLGLQKELEEYKAEVADETASKNARRGYEYAARQRLYQQVEPLLFQLFEAAEGAFHAVASLARTQRKGKLPEWLGPAEHEYYTRSIIHRLFRPLAIFQLLQRSTTLVDLTLDPTVRLRYSLLKESYLTWTDPFGLAELEPAREYEPGWDDWRARRQTSPAVHWQQGLSIGALDRFIEAMMAGEGPALHVMNFGEFDAAAASREEFQAAFAFPRDVFDSFSFVDRPVLARLLLTYASLMHILMTVYAKAKAGDSDQVDLQAILAEFPGPEGSKALNWHGGADDVAAAAPDFAVIRPYLLKRVEQAERGGYVRF